MKSGAFKRALGLTFLYVGLFVVIVLVQFSRGPGLSEKIGGLSVSASYPKTDRGKKASAPDRIRLSYAGLSLDLSPNSVAQSLGSDGSATALVPSSIDRLSNGVRIKFAPGVELKAIVEKGSRERFALTASAPDGVSALRLKLASGGSSRVADKDGRPRLLFDGDSYDLDFGSGSLDLAAGTLSLKPGDSGLALARIVPVEPKPAPAVASDKFVAPAPKDPDAIKAEIAAWRDKVWAGLSALRFDPDKVSWKGSDGLPSFSEKALTVYLAESLARGSYSDSLARVRAAKDRWPERLGYLSAPFFGGLVSKMKSFEAADQTEAKRLAQLVSDKSPSILETEGVLRFLYDRSSPSVAQDALRYISGLDASKLTIRQLVGLMGCAVDAKALLKDEDNPFRDLGAAPNRLIGAVRKTSSGYFLATEDDLSTDMRLSLLAGGYLEAYGAAISKPALVGVGQSLVEGVLGLADAQGFVPARVLAKGSELEQRMGSLSPEEFYPIVADNPYYPHEVSFGHDIAPGLWAWTCSPSLTVQASASSYLFKAQFPEGRAHFLVFYGIKPFANIQLYDIDYSPDNEFESYDASGYLYNKSADALYIKMKHKKSIEDIKLSF